MSIEPDFEHVTVHNNQAEQRYEAPIGEALAVLYYDRADDQITLIHTEVPPALEGHGIAGKLARFALDDARAHGLTVIPDCAYIQTYLRRHPADLDLVPPDTRERLAGGRG